jgi:hypothetical protein
MTWDIFQECLTYALAFGVSGIIVLLLMIATAMCLCFLIGVLRAIKIILLELFTCCR